MNKQQADYCNRLKNGNIEIAAPCENALSLGSLQFHCFELEMIGLKPIKKRQSSLAFTETAIIVSDILTGLGK